MTPPSGVSASHTAMRRQGSSPHDAATNSTFFAPSPIQNEVLENNGIKSKKNWSDRLKIGKNDKEKTDVSDQDKGYLLQEYRDKYGTLSNGSALCKSMKYAETWLYGSVSVRSPSGVTPRPSLFMYHHPPPPVTVIPEVSRHNVILGTSPTTPVSNYAIIMCSCPEFLNGTLRSKKTSAVCKKCGGSRVIWGVGTGGGTVRAPGPVMISGNANGIGGTVRLGSNTQTRTRPSLFNISPSSPKPSPPQKSATPDPYDLMRRNRLGSVTPTDTCPKFSLANSNSKPESSKSGLFRARARSTSPCHRNRRRSPSPPHKNLRQSIDGGGRISRKDLEEWEEDTSNSDYLDSSKRKSILECDVNAYELIAKYLKNKEKLRLNDLDDNLNIESLTSDDDILDDDLSDNMSDSAIDGVPKNSPRNKNVERTSKLAKFKKTDNSSSNVTSPKKPENMKKSKSLGNLFTGEKFLKSNDKPLQHNSGITIGGQTIRIFNENLISTRTEDAEYVTDEALSDGAETSLIGKDNVDTLKTSSKSSSHIPRLASPRRPPRKSKVCSNADKKVMGNNNRPRSCEEPNMSDVKNLPSDVSTTIKSILKKPSTQSPRAAEHSQTFGDIIIKPDCTASSSVATSTSKITSISPSPQQSFTYSDGQSHFYLPTFQEYKQQNRKKKQVQFNVCDDRSSQAQRVQEDQQVKECFNLQLGPSLSNTKRNISKLDKPGIEEQKKRVKDEKEAQTNVTRLSQCNENNDAVTRNKVATKTNNNNISDEVQKEKRDNNINKCVNSVEKQNKVNQINKSITQEDAGVPQNVTKDNVKSTVSSSSLPKVYFGQYGVNDADVEPTGTLRRSLSDRLSSSALPSLEKESSVVFNDTMRLRMRSGRRTDTRQVFSDPGAGIIRKLEPSENKKPNRVISPTRPRPKDPPPPPPTPPHQPELPPRHKHGQVSNKLGHQQKTSLPPPPPPMKPRPSSWSPPHLTTTNNDKTDTITIEKHHRNSDPGPASSVLKLTVTNSSNTHVFKGYHTDSCTDINETGIHENKDENRTIVTVTSPTTHSRTTQDVHRLRIVNEDSGHPKQNGTSILINGEASRTSVFVDEGVRNTDNNVSTVTINVGGQINSSPIRENATSCTVIGSSNGPRLNISSSSCNISNDPGKSTTIIPISSEVHKSKSFVFLDQHTNTEHFGKYGDGESEHKISPTNISSDCSKVFITTNINSQNDFIQRDGSQISVCKIGSRRSSSIDSSSSLHDADALLDPVEAVKRNLVPHVCGKSNCNSSNQLHYACSESIDDICEKLKGDDYFLARPCSKIVEVLAESQERVLESQLSNIDASEVQTGLDISKTTEAFHDEESERNDDFIENFDDLSSDTLSVLQPRFIIDDTDENELGENKEFVDEIGENCYESIKDPIYEEIPDIPPPLPLSPPPSLSDLDEKKRVSKSIFEGASKYDILSYLETAKERGIVQEETYFSGSSTNGDEVGDMLDDKDLDHPVHERMSSLDLGDLSSRVSHLSNTSDSSEDSCNLIITNIDDDPSSGKARKSSAEIERNDSGVGSETSKSSRSRWQHGSLTTTEDQQHLCEDCDQLVETEVMASGVMFAPLVCRKCAKKRAERKEIIAEIVETEEKYGRDLRIILEEFYRPMMVAGLLTPEQLSAIFLNSEELLDHNVVLAEKLRDALEIALEQGDEDLLTVNIGKLFLEASPMLHSFESYCVRQAAASVLLANLEKEKELLRIFLRVSQMENTVLRRMNLNSFLMVPVQRVTKYPLLLARLYKVTPSHHQGRELLKQAQNKIELHLEHMNAEAKDLTSMRIWRRISIPSVRRSSSETDMINIKLRKMALDILEWNHDEVRFAMEGKLLYTNPTDNNWRRGRTIKLHPVNALLVTNGKPTEDYHPELEEELLMFPRRIGVREAVLLLLKEKGGRYALVREPLYLDKCIVCCESDWEDYFEVQELVSRDTFIFKAEDGERTKIWYRQLQYHAQGLGTWRKRRNALANIMINGMLTRN